MKKKKIYLAGGWFTPQQEELHSRLYNLIKDEYDVFNPRLEGEVSSLQETNKNVKLNQILIGNINAIKEADIVVVIYDYKDTGTIWEAGFSYANKKPIIYYSETNGNKSFNLMLAKTGKYVSTEIELLFDLCDEKSYTFKDVYSSFVGDIE